MQRLPVSSILRALACGVSTLATLALGQSDRWPQFRGPGGSGVGLGDFPTFFGPQSNVVWSVSTPAGHSSPCVWGNQIALTGFETNQLITFCIDRTTGKERWRRSLTPGTIERGASLGNPATATACADAQRVVVYFGAYGLAAYDWEGRVLWTKPLPIPITQHGAGTSPVMAGGRVFLNGDQDVGAHLLCVDAASGKTLWKTDRPGFHRGFSTPLVYPSTRPEQIILPGTLRLVAYNFRDGTERWSLRGLPNEMVSSPVAGEGAIFVAGWTSGSGVPRMPAFDALLAEGDADKDGRLTRDEAPPGPAKQHFSYIDANKDGRIDRAEYESVAKAFDESRNVALAVRPDGFGEVTDSHVNWKATRGLPYVPSPLYYEGRLYLVRNGGLASCFEARTGRVLYQEERLGTVGDYYASPVAAGGKICAAAQPGTVVIYKAGDSLDVLARNSLGEPIIATPAIAEGRLLVRTAAHLYCFGEADTSLGRSR